MQLDFRRRSAQGGAKSGEVFLRSVAFISPKGGAGKTTAAVVLALGLAERGQRVAMIDADPNKPLVRWSQLRDPPERLSVHAAPTPEDIAVAQREAKRRDPDWIILDTEGSMRGALAFASVRPDLVLIPLAGSPLEAVEAVKAVELVRAGPRGGGRWAPRCVLTRIPAAIRPRLLKAVVGLLRESGIELLSTPLLEKEAFRALFAVGGGFERLEAEGVGGVAQARANASAFVDAVLELLGQAA